MTGVILLPIDLSLLEDFDDMFLKKMAEDIKPLDGSDLKDRLKELGRKHQKGE
ncbi:hypothetical protein [Henriciella sp.]|uniref:hypothetical protein n=1 Tax=Henriciella sp. TaxID=1968823 RepID=UPI0025B92315|nr:hypothetical protein [Henriciella sp.]